MRPVTATAGVDPIRLSASSGKLPPEGNHLRSGKTGFFLRLQGLKHRLGEEPALFFLGVRHLPLGERAHLAGLHTGRHPADGLPFRALVAF